MLKDYPYLYETHLHTVQGSACGWNTGYEMAVAAHQAGYSGIIITDHNWGGNTAADRRLPWPEWVKEFCEGYDSAKAYADEHEDFDVFFGYEAGFDGTEFLIYGISPQWLTDHPEIWVADLAQHLRMVRAAGGMVIHAHPFREAFYIPEIRLFPELVDGVEGINATHTVQDHAIWNQRAVEYARKENLPMTAGSDVHSTRLFGGGMAFRRRLRDIEDFCRAVRGREDYILTDGAAFYDQNGAPIRR